MPDKQHSETVISVGERLKRLREEKNLSIEDAARRLYLQTQVIEALEQNDYNNLPNATYVRGYLQNYAKLLGAPVESILALYDNEHTAEPVEIIPEIKPDTESTRVRKPAVAFLYLVVFVVVLLLFIWWRNHSVLEPIISADTANNGLHGSDEAPSGLPYPITIVKHPETPFYRAPIEEEMTQTEDVMEVTSSDFDENIISSGSGPDTIRMVLTSDCWIEVFDLNNEKVYYDLARVGQTLVLNGTAPFSVLLGFSSGVTIDF